jgi:hypothetical protein
VKQPRASPLGPAQGRPALAWMGALSALAIDPAEGTWNLQKLGKDAMAGREGDGRRSAIDESEVAPSARRWEDGGGSDARRTCSLA